MALPANWATGQQFSATAENSVEAAVNANTAALAALVGGAIAATVATSEATTSTTYADLTTTTDSVTATVGASGKVLLIMGAQSSQAAANKGFIGFAMSGANTAVAADAQSAQLVNASTLQSSQIVLLLTGLAAGSTTFKMKYKTSVGASTVFTNRNIAVIPFP